MLRVFNTAYNSQHQEAEPTNLVAFCKTLRSASRSRGELAPVAGSGSNFRDLSSSPDPEAFRWNGTLMPPDLHVEWQKGIKQLA